MVVIRDGVRLIDAGETTVGSLYDFDWHPSGIDFDPNTYDNLNEWELVNWQSTDYAKVVSATYSGVTHNALEVHIGAEASEGQGVRLTPAPVSIEGGSKWVDMDWMVGSQSAGYQHVFKYYAANGSLVAEIDQGGADNFSLMLFPDGFNAVVFTPEIHVAPQRWYHLQYVFLTPKQHQLKVYDYDSGVWYIGDIKNNDDWFGWAISDIDHLVFNRQEPTNIYWTLADVRCSWDPNTIHTSGGKSSKPISNNPFVILGGSMQVYRDGAKK